MARIFEGLASLLRRPYTFEVAGSPALRIPTRQITLPELLNYDTQAFIDKLVKAMRETKGIGLAAPQMGSDQAIAVVEFRPEYLRYYSPDFIKSHGLTPFPLTIIVNPIVTYEGKQVVSGPESCFSVPGYHASVPRPNYVEISSWDRNGNPQTHKLQQWPARMFLHEIDHLNGRLFIDRMDSTTFTYNKLLR